MIVLTDKERISYRATPLLIFFNRLDRFRYLGKRVSLIGYKRLEDRRYEGYKIRGMIKERYKVKENMLPLSGEERMVLQASPSRHSFSLTYCYLLYDKKAFCNNNYYLIIKHLTPYPTYSPHPLRPINKVYNIK